MTAAVPLSTDTRALDSLVRKIRDGARTFAQLGLDERRALLSQMREGYYRIAKDAAEAACRAKGIDPNSALAGEEWLAGSVVTLRNLRLLEESLAQIAHWGVPTIDRGAMKTLEDGRLAVKAYPNGMLDAALLPGTEGWIHLQAGVTAQNVAEHQALFYKRPHQGRVCVVLGGGNVNSIPPTDVIHKMFVEGTVCILKMNPVNAYLGPYLEKAFASAIERGFFAVVYGGADEGSYLVNHPLTDEIHITGSDRTHDMMIWGPPGPEREARKARREPLLKKEITSELGNISPVIVVPGPYSDSELSTQGLSIAGMVANNASFNCNSAKLLVTPKAWKGRGQLWERIGTSLERAAVRDAYYPGAEQRWHDFTDGRAGVKLIGQPKKGQLPYALIGDVDATDAGDRVFHQEPWCTVLSETGLSASDPASFLEQAVKFVNEKLWGTLCATIVIHPKTLEDPSARAAFHRAVRELRYGTVAVNTWPAACFALGSLPWGGHPSSSLQDIQSGRGFVHNTLMLENIDKAVVIAPLKPLLPFPWQPGHRSLLEMSQRLLEFEYAPKVWKLPALAASAMRA
jgi:acyl-CoA reductase-like NAD-dependent aldehyde dehydrogenase